MKKIVILFALIGFMFVSHSLINAGLSWYDKKQIEKIKAAKRDVVMEEIKKNTDQPKESTMEEIEKELENMIYKKISSMAGPVVTMAIVVACKKYGMELVDGAALAWVESKYDPEAISKKGALGVFQIMPKLYKSQNGKDPFDPFENADIGIKHLKKLLKQYNGSYLLALAAYNAGPMNVKKYGGQPPFPETKQHYNKFVVMKNNLS